MLSHRLPTLVSAPNRALFVCLLLALALAGPAVGNAAADSHTARFGIEGPERVEPGEEVTLNVTLDSAAPAYAVSFDLRVEGGTVLSVSRGPFLGSDLLVLERSAGGGAATFGATRAGVSSGVNGSGTVAQVTVAVPENASGPLSLSFRDAAVARPNASQLPTATTDREIPLAGGSAGTGDGSNAGGSTGGSGSNAAPSGSDAASVSERLAGAEGETAAVVSVAEGTSLSAVARALRANGARGIYTLPGEHAVGARVGPDETDAAAGIEGVTALRTAAEAAPDEPARVAAESLGAGRARAEISVPESVSRVSVSLPNESSAAPVAPRRIGFDAPGANGTLAVAATGVPSDAPAFEGRAVGGFTVSHPGIEAHNVSIRFEAAAEGVTLYRLENGSWNALPTERVESGASGVVYRAESPGLSAFLVGETAENGGANESAGTAATTTTAAETTTASGAAPGFTALGAFGALVALAAGLFARRVE